MRGLKLILGVSATLGMAACSADWPQRLGYHAVQNAGQLQCQKAMSNDCERRQSYDAYQREREQLQ
ncbi:hypothetical protein A1353_13000 [Methylomonas methanica]|jgi:hypothetical protein|uniref:Lipoprotein n=1 Tax=Methylomonas methanica TaxID=421 RepID=A0A177MGB8_METMH|nr:hypothetical protein [Methylomonas methanica]OAI04661.1 hypothetical protein A1353_13000 [Methylomonas methanica]